MMIMEQFGGVGWRAIRDKIVARELSIRDGVSAMFATIQSSRRGEMENYAEQHGRVREGFAAFLSFCRDVDVEFLVTSGGVDFFVVPMLAKFSLDGRIYCNRGRFDGDVVRIDWPHPCDAACDLDCGMCKPTIVRNYDPDDYYRIVIGDSLTDFAAAKRVDYVIARSYLLAECERQQLPHSSFETFYDAESVIGRLAEEAAPSKRAATSEGK